MMEHRNPHPEPRRSSQSVKILSQTWHPKHPVALQPRMGLIALQSGTQRRQPGVCHPSVRQDTAIPCLCWFWELHLSIRAQSSSRTPGFLETQWVSQGRLDKKKKKNEPWQLPEELFCLQPAPHWRSPRTEQRREHQPVRQLWQPAGWSCTSITSLWSGTARAQKALQGQWKSNFFHHLGPRMDTEYQEHRSCWGMLAPTQNHANATKAGSRLLTVLASKLKQDGFLSNWPL